MPEPVMVIELSVWPLAAAPVVGLPLLYFQFTPLWTKVAAWVLSARVLPPGVPEGGFEISHPVLTVSPVKSVLIQLLVLPVVPVLSPF